MLFFVDTYPSTLFQLQTGFVEGVEAGQDEGLKEGFTAGFASGLALSTPWSILKGRTR